MTVSRSNMSRLFICLFLLLALSIFVAPHEASAEKPTAKAARVKGPVDIILPDGKRIPLSRGGRVEPGQTIACGPDSHLVLMVSDGSRFELFENTRIEVNNLLPQEKSRFSLSLFFGRVAAKIKKLKGDDVVITPTMVAGVRGTDFTVSVADDGASVLSVNEGQVNVSTDKQGEKSDEINVDPGFEVQVDQAGVVLKARPIKLESIEAWQAFRRQRLERLKDTLPEKVDQLEKGIDTNLAELDKLVAMPKDRARILETLDKKLEALGPQDAAQRAKLTIQTYMEAANTIALPQRFRMQRMRLKTVFAQSERLKDALHIFAEPLGADYKAVDRGLARILSRKKAVQAREMQIAQQFDAAMISIQPILEKFKESGKE